MTDANEPAYLRYSREPTSQELSTLALLNEALERGDAQVIGSAYSDRLSKELSAIESGSRTYIDSDDPVGTWLQSTVREGVHPTSGSS